MLALDGRKSDQHSLRAQHWRHWDIASTDPIGVGDVVTLTLTDADLNTNSSTVQTLVLRTANAVTGEIEDRTYSETGVDTGIFNATVGTTLGTTAGTDNDGVFNVQAGDVLETVYDDTRNDCGTTGTAIATTHVIGADLTLTKTVDTSTAIPGDTLTYNVVHTNQGPVKPTDTVGAVPAETDYQVGSAAFSPGTSSITALIEFSDDGGSTYTYTPVSGGGGAPPGFDRNVTHIRYTYTGTLGNTPPGHAFDIGFSARVR